MVSRVVFSNDTNLHHALPPDDQPAAPPVHADRRTLAPLEPFDRLFDTMEEGLRPYTGAAVVEWPERKEFLSAAEKMEAL